MAFSAMTIPPMAADEIALSQSIFGGYGEATVSMSPGQGMEGLRRLTPEEVKATISHEINDSLGYLGAEINEQRRKAMRYYHGRPFGNEQDGRSQVVLTDVADTIEWIMPSIMSMLLESGVLWKFLPTKPGSEDHAKQATKVLNHVFLNQCGGWMKIYEWAKTALLEKNGFLMPEFEERFEPRRDTYRGLSEAQVGLLLENETVQIVALSLHEGDRDVIDLATRQPRITYDVETLTVKSRGQFKIHGIAPEEFLIARRAITLDDDTPFTAFRQKVTVSDLVALGYPYDVVATVPSDDMPEFSEGRVERMSQDETYPISDTSRQDPASRSIWLTTCFIRIDEDGDGYSELRRIVVVGDHAMTILSDEYWNQNPMCSLTAVPMPHKFVGLSVADQVMDLQLIRSTLLRNMLDNIYLTNNSRYEVVEGMVDIDDMLTSRPGGVVRVTAPGMVSELPTKPLPRHAMEMMSFLDSVRETRTGVSKWQQGPEPTSLKNQTSGAVSEVASAAGAKIATICKIFAETGIKDLGQKLYRLYVENATGPITYQIDGDWLTVDPTTWARDLDCQTQVGLGRGERERRMNDLQIIADRQAQRLQGGQRQMVSPRYVYATAEAIQETMGYRMDVNRFFTDPGPSGWPDPQPDFDQQTAAKEAEVKVLESKRRSREDEAKASSDQIAASIKAATQNDLQNYRMAEMQQNREIAMEQIRSQERIEKWKIEAQRTSQLAAASVGGTA
jgi:hypothetical protein